MEITNKGSLSTQLYLRIKKESLIYLQGLNGNYFAFKATEDTYLSTGNTLD